MAFKDYFIKPTTVQAPTTKNELANSFAITSSRQSFGFQPTLNPLAKINGVYVNGQSNLFPQYLNDLYSHSPLLSAIIKFKRQLAVGHGFTVEGEDTLNLTQKVTLNQMSNLIDNILDDTGFDYFLASKFYVEVTWNKDHTKIINLKYVPHEKLRVSATNEKYETTEYEYCFDYSHPSMFEKIKCAVFNPADKENHIQIDCLEVRSPGQIIYNRPEWESAIDWAEIDKETSTYHSANINNSLNPSALFQFFQKPANIDEERKILEKLNLDFAGAKNTGRAMAFFNKNKETAIDFKQLEPNKLDKTFISLGDAVQRQLCFALGIDPAILGLRVSSQLGQGVNLNDSFGKFQEYQIIPAQRRIEKFFQKYYKINGLLGVKFKLNQSSTSNAVTGPTSADAAEPMDIEKQAQANLRGSVGGVQGIIQIQTAVSQGIADYEAAIVMLQEIFGFDQSIARQILGTPAKSKPQVLPS